MAFYAKLDLSKMNVPGQTVPGAVQMSEQSARLAFAHTELMSRGFFIDSDLNQISAGQSQLPLLTWPFLDFLQSTERSFERLIELGSGNSTKWLARIFTEVQSFETNPEWCEQVRKDVPANCTINLVTEEQIIDLDISYKESDSVLVDFAGKRSMYIKKLLERKGALPNTIFLDNADWYRNGAELLHKAGFAEIPFFGFKSGQTWLSCTSLFTRDVKNLISKNKMMKVPVTARIANNNAWDVIE